MTLRNRFLLALIGLVAVPMSVVVLVAFSEMSSVTMTALGTSLDQQIRLVAGTASGLLADGATDLRVVSQADVLEGEDAGRITQFLEEILQESDWLDAAGVLRLSGSTLAATSRWDEQPDRVFEQVEQLITRAEGASQGDVFIGAGVPTANGVVIPLLTPITDDSNAEIHQWLVFVWPTVQVKTALAGLVSQQKGGGAFVLDVHRNVLLASPGPEMGAEPSFLRDSEASVGYQVHTGAEGRRFLVSQALITRQGRNDPDDWTLVAIIPVDELMGPVQAAARQIGLIAIASAALTLLIGLIIGRSFVLPIEKLVEVAGDFPQSAEVLHRGHRIPEIDVLSRALGHAADRVNQHTADLEAVRAELQRAQHVASLGSWQLGPLAGGMTWSDELHRLLGLLPGDCSPSLDRLLSFVPPQDRARLQRALDACSEWGTPIRAEEFRLLRPDGTKAWVSLNAQRDPRDPSRITGTMLDVTRARQLDAQLRQSQKLEAVGQLAGGIAHDFNNALGIILGNLELAESTPCPVADHQEFIEGAIQGANRAAELTSRLLAFARTDTKASSPVDVNKVITEAERLLSKSLTPAYEVALDLIEEPCRVELDPGDMQDALVNLVINARDAMPDGGAIRIRTTLRTATHDLGPAVSEQFVCIEIVDEGVGMPPEVVSRVFEPFFTTKEIGKGTGLGLPMVYGFVQRTGGTIDVRSEVGRGTTITIRLPISDGASTAPEVATDEDLPRGSEAILLVDDEPDLATLAAATLVGLGYEVRTAVDAEDATRILKEESNIDLLFSDVVMPGRMNGFQLAHEARRLNPEIRVLMTSGFAQPEVIDDTHHELMTDLLAKPYTRRALAVRVREVLDRPDGVG